MRKLALLIPLILVAVILFSFSGNKKPLENFRTDTQDNLGGMLNQEELVSLLAFPI